MTTVWVIAVLIGWSRSHEGCVCLGTWSERFTWRQIKIMKHMAVNPVILLLPLCAGIVAVVSETVMPTYISSNGTNDTQCFNGGASRPCKTLGHVLLLLSNLQCASCTVMVTYGHEVFPLDNSSTIDITLSAPSLHIAGVNCPKLTFSGHTIIWHSNSNTTELTIESMELANCGASGACMTTEDGSYHVQKFNLLSVIMSSIGPIHIAAQYLLYWDCSFKDITTSTDKLSVVRLMPPFCNATIVNCSFEGSSYSYITVAITNSTSLSTVTISRCNFTKFYFEGYDVTPDYVAIFLSVADATIDINIKDCVFWANKCTSLVRFQGSSSVEGNVSMTNNQFIHNSVFVNDLISKEVGLTADLGLIDANFSGNTFLLVSPSLSISGNVFTNNTGLLIHINSLPKFMLQNSTFNGNRGYGLHLVHIITSKNSNIASILIQNVSFHDNAVSTATLIAANKAAVILIEGFGSLSSSIVCLSNTTFTLNTGTPLAVVSAYLRLEHSIQFNNNTALTGGGLYLDGWTEIECAKKNYSLMEFVSNTALYGGGIYADINALLSIDCPVRLKSNNALVGKSMFAVSNCKSMQENVANISKKITCIPINFKIGSHNSISLFPGQIIILSNMTVTDSLGRCSACTADVFLLCNDVFCPHHYLVGPPTTFLKSDAINTGLRLMATTMTLPTVTPQLQFVCRTPTAVLPSVFNIMIDLLDCSLGLSFNSTSQQCQCTKDDSALFICSDQYGRVCVKKGYWYGELGGITIVSTCSHSLCNFERSSCPSGVAPNPAGYVSLASQDEQCLHGHGGILCTNCSKGHRPTYDTLKCVPSTHCAKWHPYFLLVLFIVCPLLVGIFFLFVVQLKLGIGSGYLYGPIFYLAVLSKIPLSNLSIPLSTLVSVVTESFLLNMKVLGLIPLCFFDLPTFPIKCLKLIPPTVLLILVVFIATCAPRLFKRFFHKLPTEGICMLVLISFWSLATTCIEIITPAYLSGLHGARVYFSPDLVYFHTKEHISLCIVALIILITFACVTIVLMISPFVSIFHRLKPLLDEFQSCYKDNCRWYGGVYFISWIVLEVFLILSDYLKFLTLLVILIVAHFSIQPYSRKWLNIMDGVLLVSLVFTTSLSLNGLNITNGKEEVVLTYLSILVPFTYIVFGICAILLARCGAISRMRQFVDQFVQSWKRRHVRDSTIQDPARQYAQLDKDRDSLIGILQEEELQYGTFDRN